MQFNQTFLQSSVKVTSAVSRVAVPVSPDGATGSAARLLGAAGWAELLPQVSCTALQPQCSSPAGHVPPFSRCLFGTQSCSLAGTC